MSDVTVHTWADGYGTWHARVTENGASQPGRAHRMARAAILSELEQREGPKFNGKNMTLVVVNRTGPDTAIVSEYVETWPSDNA